MSWDSPNRSVTGVDLADVIEPRQSFLLNNSSEQNIITKPGSTYLCVGLLGIRRCNLDMTTDRV